MKLRSTLLALAFVIQIQAQNLQWAKGFGGTFDEESAAIAVDASGNVYTAGYFWNTVDFDPGPGTFTLSSVGNSDIYVQKLNAAGNFVWAGSMGSVADDNAGDITVDANGDVYMTGTFNTLCDFDPGPGSFQLITPSGSFDAFVLKLSSSGSLLWVKQMGGTSDDDGMGVFVDGSGNIYTTGKFQGTVDFDPGAGTTSLTSAGSSDIFVQKLTSTGSFAWAKSFGGATGDEGTKITVDASGNVITTGYFQAVADFDPGIGVANLTSSGLKDVFISKLDPSGNYLWAKQLGGAADDLGRAITTDVSGNVYLTGGFSGLADMDPGTGTSNAVSNGLDDIFVLKLSGTGNYGWSAQMGSTTTDKGMAIYANNSEVIVAGDFSGTVDFDPGTGTANLSSSAGGVFIQKLTAAGAYSWAINYGGSNLFAGAIDASGHIYTTGIFGGTSDMDPGSTTVNLTASGNTDIYVHKLDQLPVGITEQGSGIEAELYPNPSHGSLFVKMNGGKNAEITIYDMHGNETLRMKTESSLTELNLQGFADGIYVLTLKQEGMILKKRLAICK